MNEVGHAEIQIAQRLTRCASLGLALRRWPYSWAERQWGYGPTWWLRVLSAPVVTWQVLRSRARFPIEQSLRFDADGVLVHSPLGERRMGWQQFSGWIDFGRSAMLVAPGVDLPVLLRQLPKQDAARLRDLLSARLTPIEPPKR